MGEVSQGLELWTVAAIISGLLKRIIPINLLQKPAIRKRNIDRNNKEFGLVAQSVEQRTENPCVGGSIPPQATNQLHAFRESSHSRELQKVQIQCSNG